MYKYVDKTIGLVHSKKPLSILNFLLSSTLNQIQQLDCFPWGLSDPCPLIGIEKYTKQEMTKSDPDREKKCTN
jgi:hypothetical protein